MVNEIGIKTYEKPTQIPKAKFTGSRDVRDYCKQIWPDDIGVIESFYVLFCNRVNNVVKYCQISRGGIAGTVVDPRLILKYAIDCLASSVFLVHNHPSGNTKPSNADRAITKKIKDALKMVDIEVLDHVIITEGEDYFSFSDEGLLR